MLDFLHIHNLALIEDVKMEFVPGINVLTGESGAGKSLILRALGFALGAKPAGLTVRESRQQAFVEAAFHLQEQKQVVFRRELLPGGRSKCYCNGKQQTQNALRELSAKLVVRTSQHDQLLLLQPAFQNELIEKLFPQQELLLAKKQLLQTLQELVAQKEQLLAKQAELTEKKELLEIQSQAIDTVAPKIGEEEKLEALRLEMRKTAQKNKQYAAIRSLLYSEHGCGLLDLLNAFVKLLRNCEEDASVTLILNRAQELLLQIQNNTSFLEFTPTSDSDQNLDKIEERLYNLAQLKRKLHRSMSEIFALRSEIAQNLSFLDECTLEVASVEKKLAGTTAELAKVVTAIRPLRHAVTEAFVQQMDQQLSALGFTQETHLLYEYTPEEIWPNLFDENIHLLWHPNPGHKPQPLHRIASGGEISRLLLALAVLQKEEQSSPVYIFDEIDAGLGGVALSKMADKLMEVAKYSQILLVTHWPQLAARAQRHFRIHKVVRDNATFTVCQQLKAQDINEELTRMSG